MDQTSRHAAPDRRRPPVAIALIAAATLAAPAASAAEDAAKAIARARLEDGAQRLAAGDNAGALSDFEEAYRLFPSPKIQFDIGLANFRLGRNPVAYRAFERFLQDATDATPGAVSGARARLDVLRPKIATVAVVCPRAGLQVAIDDVVVGETPLSGPVYLDPGPHRIATSVSRRVPALVSRSFTVKEGDDMTLDLPAGQAIAAPDLRPDPPRPLVATSDERRPPAAPALLVQPLTAGRGPEAPSPPLYRRPWLWAAGAGLAAAVGVTLWLTLGHSPSDPMASLGRVTLPGRP